MQHRTETSRLFSRRRTIVGAIAALTATGTGAVPALCHGKVYPGMRLGNTDLSGLDRDEVRTALVTELADFESKALKLRFEDQEWSFSLNEVGFAVDYDAMIDRAMAHGREEGYIDRYRTYLSYEDATDLPLILKEHPSTLESKIRHIAKQVNIEPINASLIVKNGEVEVSPHIDGLSVDIKSVANDSIETIRLMSVEPVILTTSPLLAEITSSDLESAKEAAWKITSEPLTFFHGEDYYSIDSDMLKAALKIDSSNNASLDLAALSPRFEQINQVVSIPPKNVTLGWKDGPIVIAPDEDGASVDVEKMGQLAAELATRDERIVELPMRGVKADARVDNLDSLGLTSLLGQGSSSFAGSSFARGENVRISADHINYKLIAPGEVFSFNDLIGVISEDNGYVAGTIIQGDWVATDIGGGVCQVSTTVFRAAANAGFRFNEWNPHSWRLAFYETDGSDPGYDAAIYQAESEWEWELDLRFENVLDSWLLLVMSIEGETVTASFFGRDPGWNVEIYPAQVSDPIQPGEPIERINSDLAPGDRVLQQSAQPGYIVRIRRVITANDGNIIADGEFVSEYVPQPEAWEVGS